MLQLLLIISERRMNREFHEKQRVWCVMRLAAGATMTQIKNEFHLKYANHPPEFRRIPPSSKRTVTRLHFFNNNPIF